MLTELTTQHKVTGAKQVTRALKNAKALTEPIQDLCEDLGVDIEEVETMAQLGQACGIAVGSAVAALVE